MKLMAGIFDMAQTIVVPQRIAAGTPDIVGVPDVATAVQQAVAAARSTVSFPKLDPEPETRIAVDYIGEAPVTGRMYGRRNRSWELAVPLAGNVQMGGELLLWRNPIEPTEACTKAYADTVIGDIDGGYF